MPNNNLTTTLAWSGTITIPAGQPYRPFTLDNNGKVSVTTGGVTTVLTNVNTPISRVRLRAPNATTNAANVLYGTSAHQTIPITPTMTTPANCAFEHIEDLSTLYFTGTATDVVEVDIYV